MSEVFLRTKSSPWRRLYNTNTTSNSAPAPVDTLTEPASDDGATPGVAGIINLTGDNVSQRVAIAPYGVGADAATLDVYVYGWAYVKEGTTVQWHPTLLAKFSAALASAATGVASGIVTETNYFTDTFSSVVGTTAGQDSLSKTNGIDKQAIFVIDTLGFNKIQIYTVRGTATSTNALIKQL